MTAKLSDKQWAASQHKLLGIKVPRDVLQRFELFINLTQRELKGKYKRTFFGQLWSLAKPVALMLVYTFVFSFILRVQIPTGEPSGLNSFPIWLLCGLLPWVFFSTVVMQGMETLISNEALIRKVYFPRSILIYSAVAAAVNNWAVEMLVLVIALFAVGAFSVGLYIPLVILFMILFAVFTSGITLMLSVANVYFRDTQHLVGIALQLGMYAAPVVYPLSMVEEQSVKIGPIVGDITLFDIYQLNPMERFLVVFRDLLFDNKIPNFSDLMYVLISTVIVFLLGFVVFKTHERKLAEVL